MFRPVAQPDFSDGIVRYSKRPDPGYVQWPGTQQHPESGAVYAGQDQYGRAIYAEPRRDPPHVSGHPSDHVSTGPQTVTRDGSRSTRSGGGDWSVAREGAKIVRNSRYDDGRYDDGRDAEDDDGSDTPGHQYGDRVPSLANLQRAQHLERSRRNKYEQSVVPDVAIQMQAIANGLVDLRDLLGSMLEGSYDRVESQPPSGPWPTRPDELGFADRVEELDDQPDQWGYSRRPSAYSQPLAPIMYTGPVDDPHCRERSVNGGIPIPQGEWRDLYQATSTADRLAAMMGDYRG